MYTPDHRRDLFGNTGICTFASIQLGPKKVGRTVEVAKYVFMFSYKEALYPKN